MEKKKLFGRLVSAFAKKSKKPFCSAVVVAAGSSTRMNGVDKIYADLGGRPVLAYSLMALQASNEIKEIIIVTREDRIVDAADICAAYGIKKATKVVCGGDDRVDSVLCGVAEVSAEADIIAVHDGARPFVTEDIIKETVARARKFYAAAPAVPVSDTIKTVENGVVVSTLDRASLAAFQTPQIFSAELLKGALQNAKAKKLTVTDDCSAVEAMGAAVHMVPGSPENIKLTTEIDFVVARAILKARAVK